VPEVDLVEHLGLLPEPRQNVGYALIEGLGRGTAGVVVRDETGTASMIILASKPSIVLEDPACA
jgi:hypothetical protein